MAKTFKCNIIHPGFKNKKQIKTGSVVNALWKPDARNLEITPEDFCDSILNGDVFIPSVCNTPIKTEDGNNLILTPQNIPIYNPLFEIHTKWDEKLKKSILNDDYSTFNEFYKIIYRKQEKCWTEQWLLGLDFDSQEEKIVNNKIYPEIIINFNKVDKILKDNNLTPFFIYETMGHTVELPKRRYVFKLEKPITSYQEAKWYQYQLMNLFPKDTDIGCDKSCSDLCRVFFGTNNPNKLVFFDADIYQDLSTFGKPPAFQHTDFQVLYNSYYHLITPIRTTPSNYSNTYNGKCPLLDKWNNQDYSLGFSDMQMLMTIYTNVENGRIEWEKLLYLNQKVNGTQAYDPDIWLNNFDTMKSKEYKCISCKKCNHCIRNNRTPLDFFQKKPVINIKYLGEKIYNETIDDASKELNDFIMNNYQNMNFKYAINAPTGVGKTEIMIKIAKPNDILCAPTHALIEEIAQRFLKNGNNNYIISLKIPPLLSQSDEDEYISLVNKGMVWEASNFWKNIVNKYPKPNIHQDYLNNQEIIKKCNDKIILCTHAKLNHLIRTRKINNMDIGVIYIDEDPTENIFIKEETIYLSDLEKLINLIIPGGFYIKELTDKIQKIYEFILSGKKTINWMEYISDFNFKEIKELKNIFSNYFYKQYPDIQYPVHHIFSDKIYDEKPKIELVINKFRMEVDKNKADVIRIIKKNIIDHNRIFLFSATINSKMAKHLGFDFKNIDYNYRNENLIQYPLLNLNKSDLTLKNKDNSECIKKAKKINDILLNEDVIILTHMGLDKGKNIFQYINKPIHPQIHFWNSEGYDILKGKDIAIIGTPRKHDNAIFTIAAGLDIPITNIKKNKIKQKLNDFDFIYYTFSDPKLAEIETYLIDKELTQLIGRSRTTRTDAKVFIFSNYPTKGINLKGE
jgi:hypothetical protein